MCCCTASHNSLLWMLNNVKNTVWIIHLGDSWRWRLLWSFQPILLGKEGRLEPVWAICHRLCGCLPSLMATGGKYHEGLQPEHMMSVQAPSLEVFRTRLDKAPSSLVWPQSLLEQEAQDRLRSLLTSSILQSYLLPLFIERGAKRAV